VIIARPLLLIAALTLLAACTDTTSSDPDPVSSRFASIDDGVAMGGSVWLVESVAGEALPYDTSLTMLLATDGDLRGTFALADDVDVSSWERDEFLGVLVVGCGDGMSYALLPTEVVDVYTVFFVDDRQEPCDSLVEFFEFGTELEASINDGKLVLTTEDSVLVAAHFRSMSQTGPVEG